MLYNFSYNRLGNNKKNVTFRHMIIDLGFAAVDNHILQGDIFIPLPFENW